MNKAIAVFDNNLTLGAFIVVKDNKLKIDYYGEPIKKQLKNFLDSASSQSFKAKVASQEPNGTTRFGLVAVGITDPRFVEALSLELGMRGFNSSPTSLATKQILFLLSDKNISRAQRESIIGDILNLPDEDAALLKESVKSLNGIVKEILENRKNLENN